VKRQSDKKEENEDEDEKDDVFNPNRSRCTLSGVLNVVDGVSSQEGRIVLMTSNHAEMLDKALIRPGRIDRMIFLGNISQRSAELMFLRMFAPDHTSGTTPPDAKLDLGNEELQKLALDFSSQIPEDTFTPAQLQGYLLNRRNSPSLAAAEASAWAEEEKDIMDAARIRAQEAKAWRAKKRRQRKMKHFTEDLLDGDNAAVFLAAARERMNGGAKEERTTETEDKDLEKVGNPDGGAVVSKEGQAEAQKEASILVEKIQRLEELNEALNQGLTNSGAEEGVTKVEGVDANKENMATVRDVGMTEQIRHNPTEA
jgi:chaperone BCS1